MDCETHYTLSSMQIMKEHDIYFSTCSGSLIHLKDSVTRNSSDIKRDKNKKTEVTALSWGRTEDEILLGYDDGDINSYNMNSETFENITNCKASKIVSVVPFKNDLIIATESGNVYHQNKKSMNSFITNNESSKTIRKAVLNPYENHLMAVGGVDNDLKLYDLVTKQARFQAKGDRHDDLNLKQPISISGIAFLDSCVGNNVIGTVTLQGMLRLYDIRAQRRPIKVFKHQKDTPSYTCLSTTDCTMRIVVGTNKGCMQLFDVRQEVKPLRALKIYMGGVVDIVGTQKFPEILSCGLDRYFRIHSTQTLVPNYEEYLKIRITNMIVRPKIIESFGIEEDVDEVAPKKRKT